MENKYITNLEELIEFVVMRDFDSKPRDIQASLYSKFFVNDDVVLHEARDYVELVLFEYDVFDRVPIDDNDIYAIACKIYEKFN